MKKKTRQFEGITLKGYYPDAQKLQSRRLKFTQIAFDSPVYFA